MGTSYIPFPPWAMLFCFVPLMHFWMTEPRAKNILLAGWICQFVFTLIGFNWIAHTVSEFGRLPYAVAILALLAFCSFANLHIPLSGWIWHRFFSKNPSPWVRVLSLIVILCIAERIYPMIFDWNMGYPWLWARLPGFHLADLIGFFGLSTITFFLQGLVLYFWSFQSGGKRYLGLAYAFLAFVLLNVAGQFHAPKYPEARIQKFAIIQANIGNLEKQMAYEGLNFRQSIIDRYVVLSLKENANSPDFYVWPETAFPDVLSARRLDSFYGKQVVEFLSQVSGTLITGSYSESPRLRVTNSLLFLTSDGFTAEPYHKTDLLAFGEYLPMGDIFPWLKKMLPQVADFDRGAGPEARLVGDLRVGGQICYEGLFDRFSRDLANQGAQVLVNVTNDSWFGNWQQPWQHLYMTLARAIEVRRPLIRSTNTGISTVITAEGNVLNQSPLHQPWSFTYEVPVVANPPKTFFMGIGYWVWPTLLVMLLGVCLWRRKN